MIFGRIFFLFPSTGGKGNKKEKYTLVLDDEKYLQSTWY